MNAHEMREAAAKVIATNELLSVSIGPLFNAGWNAANMAGAAAIRAIEITGERTECKHGTPFRYACEHCDSDAINDSHQQAREEGARLAIAAAAKACRDHGDDWKRGVGNWTASEFLARADTAYDCALAVRVISIESILKGGK